MVGKSLRPIAEVASELGLGSGDVELYGSVKAKVPVDAIPSRRVPGRLVVVTAITPTPAGEGKSTVAVGLTQGLGRLGKSVALTIRQPSLGPVFGHKGGGTGGGRATVQPAEEINLHFTGDFHAVESAHNLLAAMADNAAHRKTVPGLEAGGITWRRVTDAEDRSLRQVVTGVGGRVNGPMREARFDISAASEIMAILALASGYADLRRRLGDIVLGWTKDREPVRARDIGGIGSLMALLRDALKPNLAQTAEGQPAIVHMGPFGNIAHGCSSILADRLAVNTADLTVTEAGFGADLGFEKFMDIKIRQGGPAPSAAVVVATIRGLKWHGGVKRRELGRRNVSAVQRGALNLANAIRIVNMYGLPAVVAINRFPSDSRDEMEAAGRAAEEAGAVAVAEANGFAAGSAGMTDLAAACWEAVHNGDADVKLLYSDNESLQAKVERLAEDIYQADIVEWGPRTRDTAERFARLGWNFPVCMAKTHLSVSAKPELLNVPTGHTLPIRELRVQAGAQQIVTLAGDINTLPGLPSHPNALDIDLDDATGEITGILST
ncbi:MAG: formate--tetrahydrofolate ligase [Gammaproteobacteria bacterium]|nr:formate--tetrahydrofolate ligase [Gammaproteobacteria bacterium]MDE0366228.1 formate--tetrahydrofolate ligase [Gammaproteobacteria bacterium]